STLFPYTTLFRSFPRDVERDVDESGRFGRFGRRERVRQEGRKHDGDLGPEQAIDRAPRHAGPLELIVSLLVDLEGGIDVRVVRGEHQVPIRDLYQRARLGEARRAVLDPIRLQEAESPSADAYPAVLVADAQDR